MTTAHLAPPRPPTHLVPLGIVGVSGGVGTSTVAAALGGLDLRVFTGRSADVVVCRGTVSSVLLAGRVVGLCDRPVVAVTELDAARPSSALRARLELLEPHTTAVVLLPCVPPWRDAVNPLAELRRHVTEPPEQLPRAVRRYVEAVAAIPGALRALPDPQSEVRA